MNLNKSVKDVEPANPVATNCNAFIISPFLKLEQALHRKVIGKPSQSQAVKTVSCTLHPGKIRFG